MSLSSTTNRVSYTGNAATSVYAYTYRITDDDHLLVTVRDTSDVETTLTKTTDYTVSGVGDAGGGNVTLVNASQAWLTGGNLKNGYVLTIRRVVPLKQETDFRNQGTFYAETHEDALDVLTMIAQQHQDELNRSFTLPETVTASDFDPELPAGIAGAISKAPVTNATGDGWADPDDWPSSSAIAAAASNASAASASASAASASQIAAAASAASAASAVNSAFFRDVVYKTNADSPLTIDSTYNGKMVSLDSSGGTITINLPQISGLTLPFNVAFKLKTAGNTVTINRGGTDVIDGANSITLTAAGTGLQFAADDSPATDEWTSLPFGTLADGAVTGAAGGGKLAASAINSQTEETAPAALDEVLIYDQSATALRKMTLPNVRKSLAATKTSGYTLTVDDDVILCDATSGGFTITLPSASTVTGKVFTVKKTDSSTNKITFSGTLDGTASRKLCTQYESVKFVSDGTNYHVLDHRTNTAWASYTPTYTNIPTTSVLYWRRVGDSMHIKGSAVATGVVTGDITIAIPSIGTFDTAKMTNSADYPLGWAVANSGTAAPHLGVAVRNGSSTSVMAFAGDDGAEWQWNASQPFVWGAGGFLTVDVIVPITDWWE